MKDGRSGEARVRIAIVSGYKPSHFEVQRVHTASQKRGLTFRRASRQYRHYFAF
jgi:hypothetical protein